MSESKPSFISLPRYKYEIADKLGVSPSFITDLLRSKRIKERLESETDYNLNKNKLSPKQLKIIDEEYGGLDD